MNGAGGNYRLFITGFQPNAESDVERFLFSDYGCTNFYPEGQGYVAEFNDVWPQHELAALRDSLTSRFRGNRFDVRYYDRGEGDAYPAYDRYDTKQRAGNEAGGNAVRTIDIRGIPYNLVNEKSATDIAKQVFSSYDPLEARAFPSSGLIQITFKQPASPYDIDQMQDDLQRELLNRGKEWGRQVRVERGDNSMGARVPAWGASGPGGGQTRGANPYESRHRARNRYRATNYENLGCIIAGIVTVFALLILVFFLFDPKSFCQSFGPIIGCSGAGSVSQCKADARQKEQQINRLQHERDTINRRTSDELRVCNANKEKCDDLYRQEVNIRMPQDFKEVGPVKPRVQTGKPKPPDKKTKLPDKKPNKEKPKVPPPKVTKPKVTPSKAPTTATGMDMAAKIKKDKADVKKQAKFFETELGDGGMCRDVHGRYIKCGGKA